MPGPEERSDARAQECGRRLELMCLEALAVVPARPAQANTWRACRLNSTCERLVVLAAVEIEAVSGGSKDCRHPPLHRPARVRPYPIHHSARAASHPHARMGGLGTTIGGQYGRADQTIVTRGDLAHLALFLWASGASAAAGVDAARAGGGEPAVQRLRQGDCDARISCFAGEEAYGTEGKSTDKQAGARCSGSLPGTSRGRWRKARPAAGPSRGRRRGRLMRADPDRRARGASRAMPSVFGRLDEWRRHGDAGGVRKSAGAARRGSVSRCCSSTIRRSRWAPGRWCARTAYGLWVEGRLVPGVPRADALRRLIATRRGGRALHRLSHGASRRARRERAPPALARWICGRSRS